jgi:hypothetical protein
MCKCRNVKIGSHKTEIIMTSWWGKKISVDLCMKEEILFLWSHKIKVTRGAMILDGYDDLDSCDKYMDELIKEVEAL